MWNPFKRKFRVPVDECINAILDAIKRDEKYNLSMDLWSWLELKGVERKWSWRESKNYLVFDSEAEYTMFLLKL